MDVLEQSAREARIIELREQRVPYRKIAAELGITHTRVIQIFQTARDRIPASRLADLRAEESDLADEAIADLLTIAKNDTINPRTGHPMVSPHARVEAWNAIRGFSESKRRLFGADAPLRKEITVLTDDVVDAAIKKLTDEMEALDAHKALDVTKLIDV